MILQRTGENLACRCRILVDEHYDAAIEEVAVTLGHVGVARSARSLGVNYKIALFQELRGQLLGCIKITASIVLKVDDEILHALLAQVVHGFAELLGSFGGKA